jgi:hypothetical protein
MHSGENAPLLFQSANADRELPIFLVIIAKKLVKNIFSQRRDYYAELRTRSLSLRCFVTLSKIMQADYQPRRPLDKRAQLQLYQSPTTL